MGTALVKRQHWQRFWRHVAQSLGLCMSVQQAPAAEVKVAVAANFHAPMQQIAQAFAQDTGHQALLSVGATGTLYAQIRHGAPFQVMLAADAETPKKLEQEGLAVPGSRFTYATGRLVLWSPQAQLVDAQGAVLRQSHWPQLAIANPKTAPYGAAAMQTLQHLGLWSAWQPRLVQGENIGQTHQWVASGHVPFGFVALSQVMRDGQLTGGSVWQVPSTFYAPIQQDAVLLQNGQNNPAAQALLSYLRSAKAQHIIVSFGYCLQC